MQKCSAPADIVYMCKKRAALKVLIVIQIKKAILRRHRLYLQKIAQPHLLILQKLKENL